MPRTRSIAWSQLKIGILAITAMMLATALIIAVGGQAGFWWQRYQLYTKFPDVKGLKKGAVVRVAGIDVGKVSGLEFSGADVQVTLSIKKAVQTRMMVSGDFEMWVRLSERWPTGFLNESLLLLRSHEEQFSRRKGIYVQFMKEDREIVDTLLRRLPLELRSHARRYEVCQRQVLYFHYLLRCLLSGNWSTASQTYREIAKQSRFGLVALIWLLTANHRLYRIRPKYA